MTDFPISDVTSPVVSNCPPDPIVVPALTAAQYTFSASDFTDNSRLVKEVTVEPAYFSPDTVVTEDINVTYTAYDSNSNSATCTLQLVIQGW